jgi:hypothetical protein
MHSGLTRELPAKNSVEKKIFIGGWVRLPFAPAAWVRGGRSAIAEREAEWIGPVMNVFTVARPVERLMVLLSAMGRKLSANVS